MNCNKCGIENKNEALICSHCGAKLEKPKPMQRGNSCPACDSKNPPNQKTCGCCGAELHLPHHEHRPRHQQPMQHKPQKRKERHIETKLKWRFAVGAIVLLAVVFVFIKSTEMSVKKQASPSSQFVETKTSDTQLEAKVLEVASKFICSCGTCGEKPLDICTCETAAQERQFIRDRLQQGQTPEQVSVAVMTEFGWLKPEFASKYDSTAGIRAKLKAPVVAGQTENVFTIIATKTDVDTSLHQ